MTTTTFIVFYFDSNQRKLILEKEIEEYLGLDNRNHLDFIQLPNGAICSYSDSSTIIYDEKTFKLVYSDCRHTDVSLMKNFSNGLIFIKRNGGNEIWVGNKENKGIKYVTTINFRVDKIKEISNNKALFGFYDTVYVYNLSTCKMKLLLNGKIIFI